MKLLPTVIVLAAFGLLLFLSKPKKTGEPPAKPAAQSAEVPSAHGDLGAKPVAHEPAPAPAPAVEASAAHGTPSPAAAPAPTKPEPQVIPATPLLPPAPRNPDSIVGHVVSTAGRGQGQIRVTLQGSDGHEVATTVSAADGRFAFDKVAAGNYKLLASDPDFLYTAAAPTAVTAVKGQAVDAQVVVSRGGARIAGVLLDAYQKPVADHKITVASGTASIAVNTDSKGRFLVNGLVDGTWTVTPEGRTDLVRTVTTQGTDTPEVTLAMVERAALRIRLVGSHLHPVALKGTEKAFLRSTVAGNGERSVPVTLVEKDAEGKELERDERYGLVAFADLLPGRYDLEVIDGKGVASLLTGGVPWAAPTPVTVEAGLDREWPLPTALASRGRGIEVPFGIVCFMFIAIALMIFVTPVLFPPPVAPKRPVKMAAGT